MAVRALAGVHLAGAARQIVVLVRAGSGGEPLEHGAHVLEQQWLVLVEHHRRGGVLREDGGPALGNAGPAQHTGDLLGHVDELAGRRGPNGERFGPKGQAPHPADARASGLVRIVEQAERRVRSGSHSSAPSGPRHTFAAHSLNANAARKTLRRPLQRVLASGRADLVEAVAAIHRAAHRRGERNLGGLAALGADHFMELLGATSAPNVAIDRPAIGTTRRLVLESFGGVELLLPHSKNKIEPAITARQSLVAEAHGESPLVCLWISETSPERSA